METDELEIVPFAGADLGGGGVGVDWVASHPPSEKPIIKI